MLSPELDYRIFSRGALLPRVFAEENAAELEAYRGDLYGELRPRTTIRKLQIDLFIAEVAIYRRYIYLETLLFARPSQTHAAVGPLDLYPKRHYEERIAAGKVIREKCERFRTEVLEKGSLGEEVLDRVMNDESLDRLLKLDILLHHDMATQAARLPTDLLGEEFRAIIRLEFLTVLDEYVATTEDSISAAQRALTLASDLGAIHLPAVQELELIRRLRASSERRILRLMHELQLPEAECRAVASKSPAKSQFDIDPKPFIVEAVFQLSHTANQFTAGEVASVAIKTGQAQNLSLDLTARGVGPVLRSFGLPTGRLGNLGIGVKGLGPPDHRVIHRLALQQSSELIPFPGKPDCRYCKELQREADASGKGNG